MNWLKPFCATDRKVLRKFSSTETANILVISDTYLREITAAGFAGDVEVSPREALLFTREINQLRLALDAKLPLRNTFRGGAELRRATSLRA